MAKCYPEIQIKCDECSNVVIIPLEYEDGWDKWMRADGPNPFVYFPRNYQDWELSDGLGERDYCPTCRVIRATEERQIRVDDCETDEPIPQPDGVK